MMSSSTSSATVAVEKATSELLINPDWTMNIDICDSVNSHQWQAKDVVKAVKKRLQHKNPKVQLLALTLLETMVKNCGDNVHFQIADRNVLGEMVKIVKKKTDMQVRDKILVLLDSWQEAFGGPGGKHPQYYWAYEELRRSGVQFPQRSLDAAPPIFTPPLSHPTFRHPQPGYGMPSTSARRLDETMATEIESLSLSSLDSMWNVMELLSDMLQAVDPSDREAVKNEVIVDLVNRCRSNQKKLMHMLTTTGDEELLGRGLELNDVLQNLLAKHDAIASGSPIPAHLTNSSPKASTSHQTTESESSPIPNGNPPATGNSLRKGLIDEEEEEEDDFAQLARRHSKPQPVPSQIPSAETSKSIVSMNHSNTTAFSPADSAVPTCTALALPDPPAPVKTTKEQDIIDLLSLTLSTTPASSHDPQSSSASNRNTHQVPTPQSDRGGNPYVTSQTLSTDQGQTPYNNYVAPWAQPQLQHPQPRSQLQPQPQSQLHPRTQPQSQLHPHLQSQPLSQQQLQPPSSSQYPVHLQPQAQPQFPRYSSVYPPPPWAATPGYLNNQNQFSTTNNMFSTPRANVPASYTVVQGGRPLQHNNSFPSRGSNGSATLGESGVTGPRNPGPTAAQKPFIPSYRLFEDLNVLGNVDGRNKTSGSSTPMYSTPGQGTLGGRK